MMHKIITFLLLCFALTSCNEKPKDHEASFIWALNFCGAEGVQSFYTYENIADRVYCKNGTSADVAINRK